MKKINLTFATAILCCAVMTGVLVQQSCGRRTPRTVRMKVGESKIILPVPAQNLATSFEAKAPQKLMLTFVTGDKDVPSDSGAHILFFENQSSQEPFYRINADEFSSLHLKTKCPASDVSLLENATESDVLICDGSLDPDKANRIELHFPNGKVKRATRVMPFFLEDDLITAGVSFY